MCQNASVLTSLEFLQIFLIIVFPSGLVQYQHSYSHWYRFYHGLWTPNEAIFHWDPELLGLARQIGHKTWAFGVFSAELSAPILVQWVSCPCFPLIYPYFYKKLSLYIQIPNIYLGLGFEFEFEFGPQRIRDLAFVSP